MPFLGKTPQQFVDPEVDIDGGSIDGTAIGATSASTATVTTFTSTGIDDNATSTAITIDASQNVGIGVAFPDAKLHTNGSFRQTGATAPFEWTVNAGAADYYKLNAVGYADNLIVANSVGNVGIGTTSPSNKLHVKNGSAGSVPTHPYTQFNLEHSSHTAIQLSTPNSVEAGIIFADPQDSDAGAIFYYHPSDFMYFRVNGAERARIDSSGVFMVGRTSAYSDGTIGTAVIQCGGLYGARTGMAFIQNSTSSTGAIGFVNPNGTVGSITTSGTSTAYNTSSDYRLKENVVDLDNAVDRLNQIPVHRFNFIADPDTTVDGFLAHEVADVVPEAISGEKDAVDDEGNPVYQGIDQSKLVPLLTAAIQEQQAIIDSQASAIADLTTRLEALEAN